MTVRLRLSWANQQVRRLRSVRSEDAVNDSMKKHYFIVVLAHSFHGRLRRLHIHHSALYAVLGLAVLGLFSFVGIASSYARMAWKVADYNALQRQFNDLRHQYSQLEESASQTNEQLATLQILATEVTLAFGVKQRLEGPDDISAEGALLPDYHETLEQYNFLKTANLSRSYGRYPLLWQKGERPSLWPVAGRLQSAFGRRTDPFSGQGTFHSGVDISAPTGTPVRTAADGIVVRAEWASSYGRLIVVDHGGGIQTYYAHLSGFDVIPGQEVRRAQIIARSGASGRVTSSHLHYEVRQAGTPINPYVFLRNAVTAEAHPPDLPF
jgi:murein DD-endopeptidase MepM/ murein hydrolase activator NlpD